MTSFDVDAHTILRVRHGSYAYGLNIETSDLDVKGVCIEPLCYHLGFLHRFEQLERMASKGHERDLVVYSLKKFAKLATDANPNIIEVLWVDESDVLFEDEFGAELRSKKHEFLSKRVRATFAGYAHAQLKRIKTHRSWLLDPPREAPLRVKFGLSETMKVSQSELGAFDAANEKSLELELSSEVLSLFTREKQYHAAKQQWEQYQTWKRERNPARAELEAKFGMDTKHGMHLVRLMRMCKEILEGQGVLVKRPDRNELLAIRRGEWSYDRIVEEAERLDTECDVARATSALPTEPDRSSLDAFVVSLTQRFVGSRVQ